ncbi:succinylglutamate desuccinylase/aspartoacylase domain-containing protein [Chondrinema litorale]|uniref:succinylglutamate desuccinylase/aspartoacylase domain-containing protein n=1 Tax=Chondrinema litorale TaxID=2994555 RepID=UPI0025436B44|nr:succinylglutamate desuccinylase/aspartoacylase family protein [Chondrinema litorale]UZR95062.1 succinylglutamate desuccinylase/aspartoacylase family protein [Chondrinema litorale]
MERLIGDTGRKDTGKLILCIGAIHGNELSGVLALERVFNYLYKNDITLNGRLIGFRGNLQAIERGQRFIDRDLNRVWADEIIQTALKKPYLFAEYSELKQLFEAFQQVGFADYPNRVFLDLHTTSAENGTFIMVEDLEDTAYMVNQLHAPVILGLHNGLLNTNVPYMHMHGFKAMAFEAGKIGSHQAIDNQELTIWQILHANDFIEWKDIPDNIQNYTLLLDQNAHLPQVMKLDYCHKIHPNDNFIMKPGFKNFDYIKRGTLLAEDDNGEIRATSDGFMLMPLYQKEGNDGFFLVSEVKESKEDLSLME